MMQTQHRPLPYARLNSFHGPKRRLLGHKPGQAPPSWKSVAAPDQVGAGLVSTSKTVQEQGSRIFLSRLPVDVGEKDVEVSFTAFKHVYFLTGFLLGAI
jgi:THO complex subunit 4